MATAGYEAKLHIRTTAPTDIRDVNESGWDVVPATTPALSDEDGTYDSVTTADDGTSLNINTLSSWEIDAGGDYRLGSEVGADGVERLRTTKRAKSKLYIRFAPAGVASGQPVISGQAIVSSFGINPDVGDGTTFSCTLMSSGPLSETTFS